jgi:hypothetical protein
MTEVILTLFILLCGIVWTVALLRMAISKRSNVKKYISKAMVIFSILFFNAAVFTFIERIQQHREWFDHETVVRLALLFVASGLFLGLYRIIDLLENR